jgi:hypothetical protein
LEQKEEEKYEKEVVKIEVEAFRANQTALAEDSTLREMTSESQLLARAYTAANTTFIKQKVATTKTMSTRTQSISKMQKELSSTTVAADKIKLNKEITQLTTENARDTTLLGE